MVKEEKQKKILYLVQLPPPVHGVSMTNRFVFESDEINRNFRKELVRLRFSENIESLRVFSPGKVFRAIGILARLIIKLLLFRPDMVYFSFMPVKTGFLRDMVYLMFIKAFRVRIILHLNNRGIKKAFHHSIKGYLYRRAFRNTCVIHVSEKLLMEEFDETGIKELKGTFVVPNTTGYFGELPVAKPHPTGRILFFSNLFPEKGLMHLLNAMLLLRKKHQELKLSVHGAGRGKKTSRMYREFIDKHQLGQVVDLAGPLYGVEKERIFAEGGIFVFPSYFEEECFPLVLLEAMQAGLPIVATKVGAVPEMLDHGNEALLVEPGDIEGLARSIDFLLENGERRETLGANARKKFFSKYSINHFEKRMRTVFERVLKN